MKSMELDAEGILEWASPGSRFIESEAFAGRDYSAAADRTLMAWMCEGDAMAFAQIFDRYHKRIVAYASKYVESFDIAKDVCQEVFLRLIDRPPSVLIYDSLSPWLFRVARNLAIDKCRRRRLEFAGDGSIPEAREENTPLKTATAKSDAAFMRKLVDRLPPDTREVVRLRVFGEVSYRDIAVILGIPQGTALWRMHRALEQLRKEWKKMTDEQEPMP